MAMDQSMDLQICDSHDAYELRSILLSVMSATSMIKLVDASFGIEKGQSLIKNLNLDIARGTFNILIGRVGSGKSLLLRSLIREMQLEEGSADLGPKAAAFCSQTPWLKNASIRDNVLSESALDEDWYDKVARACLLDRDFADLPQGDRTLVGSKGITLSGGSKNRIALARALYCRTSLLIIDDVLSGLDQNTETMVFHRVFGPHGLLRASKSTVILATHAVHFARFCDQVIVMQDGTIKDCAPYDKIKSHPDFGHLNIERSGMKGSITDTPEESGPILSDRKFTLVNSDGPVDEQRISGDRRSLLYYLSSIGYKHVAIYMALCALSIGSLAATSKIVKLLR